jgi:Putative nucleotidyltransferase DUF294
MRCTAPVEQSSALCVGLFPIRDEYQCPFCANRYLQILPSLQERANAMSRFIQTERGKIRQFMADPKSTAQYLAQPVKIGANRKGLVAPARSEKERKGWVKYLANPASADLIGTCAQKQWSKMVEIILVELFAEPLAPHKTHSKFALCISGSLARREACPYSDIESFILIENKMRRRYFQDAARKVDAILKLSTEAVRGMGFDTEVCPMLHVYTPEEWHHELRKKIEGPDGHIKRGLLTDFRFVFGDHALFEDTVSRVNSLRENTINSTRSDVVTALQNELQVRVLNKTAKKYDDASPYYTSPTGRLHVKYQFYRYFEQVPRYLCEYYRLNVQGSRKQVEALCEAGHLSEALKKHILWAQETISRLRVKIQLEEQASSHEVLTKPVAPGAQRLARTHQPTFTQDAATGVWRENHAQGDPRYLLTRGERDDLDLVLRVLNVVLIKARDFIEWARASDSQELIELNANKVLGTFRFALKKGPRTQPSPFMDPSPNLMTEMMW